MIKKDKLIYVMCIDVVLEIVGKDVFNINNGDWLDVFNVMILFIDGGINKDLKLYDEVF